MPILFAVGHLETVMGNKTIFICTGFTNGVRGMGLKIGEQVGIAGLLDLGFG